MTKPHGDFLPGDLVEYNYLARHWQPREGTTTVHPRLASGRYLEAPVGHYSIGTRLTKRMLDNIRKAGYTELKVHEEPPPWVPEARRAMESQAHSMDWMDRLAGYYTKGSLMDALTSGYTSADPNTPVAMIPQLVLRGRISQLGE
jgi:hypothetical protein